MRFGHLATFAGSPDWHSGLQQVPFYGQSGHLLLNLWPALFWLEVDSRNIFLPDHLIQGRYIRFKYDLQGLQFYISLPH